MRDPSVIVENIIIKNYAYENHVCEDLATLIEDYRVSSVKSGGRECVIKLFSNVQF